MKLDDVLERILFPDEIEKGQLVFINVVRSELATVLKAPTLFACSFP